ncbi:MAG: hypothetical protein E4H14_00410 [Candidatus Thorarchaeota archaeon]|nr:MAG: hypothetical protein E4H14_00410 [Candidatus Thorarchaeota archaeon]
MREIDEFSDDEPHLEDGRTKVRDYEEHPLTTTERDEIIREYNAEHSIIGEIDTEEAHRLYYDEGLSQRKVAEVLGYSRDQIRRLFKTQGWEPRSVGGVEKEIDHQEVHRICVEEGRPKKEAAEILGCKSTRPITRILKENDWKTPLEVKMETEIDPDEVHRLHYDEGWSLTRIANRYGYESKDIIQKLFRERDWIPVGLARQTVYEFPSEIEEDHRIESGRISSVFEQLRKKENISPLDMAHCIEDMIFSSPSKSRVKWMEIQPEQDTKITEILEDRRLEVESALNELLDVSEDSNEKARVGFVDGKLYVRKQDLSEYNWLNIYDNELFYLTSTEDKFRLVHETRARLGLSTNTDLGNLIDQLSDRGDATGSGYSDIKETTDEHVRAETLHLLLDTTGKSLQDIQGKIHCIGKIRSGAYEGKGGIRNPQFPTDPEAIDVMFSKFFGLGLSDGHIEKVYSQFVYAEIDPDRRGIVIEHSKDFGDVHYHENNEKQTQFASVFGRALRKRGFPAGDKCIQSIGLPEFIMHGSPEVVFTYFRNLWPEDGCFSIEYHRNIGYFTWDRSVVIKDPAKESEYGFESLVTDDHLELFEKYGTRVEEDLENGFKEEIYLTPTILEELTKSKNFDVSSLAKELNEIVLSNQSQLLNDEIETLRRAGVHANQRLLKLTYQIESSRVSISRRGKIYRKRDVMRTALQMLPDDIRKSAKVEEWMNFWPKLRREVERELADLDNNHGNNGESH